MSRENMSYLNSLSAGFHGLSIHMSLLEGHGSHQTFPCNPFSLNHGDSALPLNLVGDVGAQLLQVPRYSLSIICFTKSCP